MARQKFLNKNFPSMNMSDEEKEKMLKKGTILEVPAKNVQEQLSKKKKKTKDKSPTEKHEQLF